MAETVEKPSFIRSTWEGIKGFVKGGMTGALIGALVVGGIAAVIGVFAPTVGLQIAEAILPSSMIHAIAPGVSSALAGSAAAAGAAAVITAIPSPVAGAALAGLSGATVGAALLAPIGASAGTMTGVIRSRETPQPSVDDIANVAKMSMVQGMAIEHQRAATQQAQAATTTHRDRLANERTVVPGVTPQNQVH